MQTKEILKPNSSEKVASENAWSELEKLREEKKFPISESIDGQTFAEKTPEEKQKEISEAAAKVKEAYNVQNINEARPMVEMHASEKSATPPNNSRNAFTKAIDFITNRFGTKTRKKNNETVPDDSPKCQPEKNPFAENQMRYKMLEETKMKDVAENPTPLDNITIEFMGFLHDKSKQERFEKQKIQEVVERDLNSRLLTVDNLETEVISENPEIQKHFISFEDADIPVYDLKGLPFSILSTTIDFKKGLGPRIVPGAGTYEKILKNPAIWSEKLDEVMQSTNNFVSGGRENARGTTISTSYWNSEKNINSHKSGELIYGFDHVDAGSLIDAYEHDGRTNHFAENNGTTFLRDANIVEKIENASTVDHNEIRIQRYGNDGTPKNPDYIVIENGNATEASLRHAKYFNIPIVNIERSFYNNEFHEQPKEIEIQ